MKKLICLWGVMCLLSACSDSIRRQPPRKMLGIDYAAYSAYTQPAARETDDYTGQLPQPSMLDEQALAPAAQNGEQPADPALDYEPAADEDFTSEEIAASYGRYTDVTVVAAVKRIKLGAQATTKEMDLFQQALAAAYKKALRTYRPSGFTYSIASVGAVNPLSDIEVNCVLGEQAANEIGQQTCKLFFNTLQDQYRTLQQEAQHAALQ